MVFRANRTTTVLKGIGVGVVVFALFYVADRSGFSRTSQLGRLQASLGMPLISLGGAALGLMIGYTVIADKLARRMVLEESHLTVQYRLGTVRLPYEVIERVAIERYAVYILLKEPRNWRPYFTGTQTGLSRLQSSMAIMAARYDCDLWMFPADLDGRGKDFVDAVTRRLPQS